MELKQIEYDYENANISYALQQLNTEKSITDQFYSVYMAQSNLESVVKNWLMPSKVMILSRIR